MRKTKFLLALMLMLVVVMCLPAFAEEENLWYDGGFDNVNTNGTTCLPDDYRNFCGEWNHYLYPEGYLAIAGSANHAPAFSNAQSLNLSTSSTYKLSLKIKNDTPGDTAYLKVLYSTEYTTAVWNCTTLATVEGTDDWTTYEIELPSSANFIYFRSLHDSYPTDGNKWICVDDISVVKTSETEEPEGPEVTYNGLWPDGGLDELPQGDSERIIGATGYEHIVSSVGGYQYKVRDYGTGNPKLQLCGARRGAFPITLRNAKAFDLDNSKTYTLSFDFAIIESYGHNGSSYTNEPGVFQIFVGSEAKEIAAEEKDAEAIAETYDVTLVDTYEFANNIPKDPTSVSIEIPAGVDAKYVYIRFVSDMYITFDNIGLFEGETVEAPIPVVAAAAAGLAEDENALGFAAYVNTEDAYVSEFGFEVSATNDFTNAIVVEDCAVVAYNGDFCGVSAAGDYYMVRVNGVPADKTVYVRAYSVFNGDKVYSDAVSASVNDVVNA